jgi:hypothetical protein
MLLLAAVEDMKLVVDTVVEAEFDRCFIVICMLCFGGRFNGASLVVLLDFMFDGYVI